MKNIMSTAIVRGFERMLMSDRFLACLIVIAFVSFVAACVIFVVAFIT